MILAQQLKKLLGTIHVIAQKSQAFHWNLEGPNFPQYHEFFGDYYEDIHSSIDKIAEIIRQLDTYSPTTLARMIELSDVQEQDKIPTASLMMRELFEDNQRLIDILNVTFEMTEADRRPGIGDFISNRIDSHEKWQWMLRSILKTDRE